DILVEYVRYALSATITQKFQDDDNKIYAVTLDPAVEQALVDAAQQSGRHGIAGVVDLPPKVINGIYSTIAVLVEKMTESGRQPMVVTSPTVRQIFRRLIEPVLPQVVVLSYGELLVNVQVDSVGVVSLSNQ
ncbi:FHIPEP family type III secretion protein, partial [Calditrichota bacterium]